MSFRYLREMYGVPAMRGARVTYRGRPGTLVSATHYANIRLDGEAFSKPYHPTDPDLVWPTPERKPSGDGGVIERIEPHQER